MNWGAAVEGVRTMGVPHPVRRHIQLNPSTLRGFPDNAPHLGFAEAGRFPLTRISQEGCSKKPSSLA
jgi:hypothetical protein